MWTTRSGEIAALLTALCWTLSTITFSSAGKRVGSLSVNIIRLVVAWVCLVAYCWIARGLPFPSDAPASAWLWLTLSGIVGFFLGDLCLFKALILIGPRLTTLLMSLAPPIAAILALFVLDETLTLRHWGGMAITLFGVSWVVLERRVTENGTPHPHAAGGVLLAILAAAGQAVGLVLSKKGMGPGDYDPFASTQIRVIPAIIAFAVLLGCVRWYPRVLETLRHPRALSLIVIGAVLGPFLGVALLLFAVQHIKTGVAQTIVAIIPVLILPFVIVLYKERVSWRAALGAVAAVGGVALLCWN